MKNVTDPSYFVLIFHYLYHDVVLSGAVACGSITTTQQLNNPHPRMCNGVI